MLVRELEEAINEIGQACDAGLDGGCTSPFFWVVGAGISCPEVPLAGNIEQHCNERLGGKVPPPSATGPIDRYSHWFEQAYPQPFQRQRYLRSLIEGRTISHANFRLAHLLASGRLGKLVITPNFDDFLSRALNLLGYPHVVCDHPGTVSRIDPESQDLQIVHVHGTYWFYDCCNLRVEIEGRALSDTEHVSTMLTLLDRVLSRRSPLVLGYSGWEGDVIMSALRRRLQAPMACRLYWFCYRRQELDSLPVWLRGNPHVIGVVAPERFLEESRSPSKPGADSHGLSKFQEEIPSTQNLLDGMLPAEGLRADVVLDKLVERFHLETPEILRNPIRFLITQLRAALPAQGRPDAGGDVYSFQGTIDMLERFARHQPETDPLEEVRDALRRSQYREAVCSAAQCELACLSPALLRELIESMWSCSRGLLEDVEVELAACDIVIRASDTLGTTGDIDPHVDERVGAALVEKGLTLGRLGRSEEALSAFDDVIQRFDSATELRLREWVAKALVNKGVALSRLGLSQDALTVFDDVVHRFGNTTELSLREQVARALLNGAIALGELGHSEQELSAYDNVVHRFGAVTEWTLPEAVARALVNKAVALTRLGRCEEALSTCDDVVHRFGQATELPLRESVARALVIRAVALGELGHSGQELSAYDDVVHHFGAATEWTLREAVAKALVNKSVALSRLGRREEALSTCDDVVHRFGAATELSVRELVAWALVNKGSALGELGRPDQQRAIAEALVHDFSDVLPQDIQETLAGEFGNRGEAGGAKTPLRQKRRSPHRGHVKRRARPSS